MLAQVLEDIGTSLSGYWPMFNGEKASSLVFGGEHWCEAIITLHHLGEQDFDLVRQLASWRQHPGTPLTFKELFDSIEPSLQHRVHDWSNMSKDIALKMGSAAGVSVEACFNACLEDRKCVQYEHTDDTCRLSHNVRLGQRRLGRDGKRWTSGWLKDRIESFKNAQSECLEGAHDVHLKP